MRGGKRNWIWTVPMLQALRAEWADRGDLMPKEFDAIFAGKYAAEGIKQGSVESKRQQLGLTLTKAEKAALMGRLTALAFAGKAPGWSRKRLFKAPECVPLPEEKPESMPLQEWIALNKAKAGGRAWV